MNVRNMINCVANSLEIQIKLNLSGDLNEKYITNLHHIITIQWFFISNEKTIILAYICMHANSVHSSKTRIHNEITKNRKMATDNFPFIGGC